MALELQDLTSDNLHRDFVNVNLILSQGCNLSCSYCYQPEGFRKDTMMSTKVLDDTIVFMSKKIKDQKLLFVLFGGEPLLNFEAVKYAVEKYSMHRFMLVTNGLILLENPEIREWCFKHKNNLVVSFSMGSLKTRYGDKLAETVQPILDLVKHTKGDVHYVVETIDESTLKDVEYLCKTGIRNLRFNAPKQSKYAMEHKDEYIKLFQKIVDIVYSYKHVTSTLDTAFRSNIARKRQGLPTVPLGLFCGSGFHYLAVDWEGNIFPCDYFIVYPEFKIGTIYTDIDKDRIFKDIPNWNTELTKYCTDCPLGNKELCTNALCLGENYRFNHNLFKPTPEVCNLRAIESATYTYILDKYGYSKPN